MNNRILISGFEPFGGEVINPSWEAVKGLPDRVGPWQLRKIRIPVVFGQAARQVWAAAEAYDPAVILCVGQAGGRCSLTPEQVAINLRNGTDNSQHSFQDAPVCPGGPDAYFTTLPIREMVSAMQDAGVPAAISYSAGTYVCNDTMYQLLHRCAGSSIRAGFLHIPYLPQQTKGNTPCLPLQTLTEGLRAAIEALEPRED